MGEYSIAKSFKGILRVAHIMELVDGETDYFLSPTYFGKPKQLMNISGGTYKSKEYGYQTAIKAMQTGGGINICWMDGLADIMYGEVVEFECGERGMVLDIQVQDVPGSAGFRH